MKYIIFSDIDEAMARSFEEMSRQNPNRNIETLSDTPYYWAYTQHTGDGRVALHIPDEQATGDGVVLSAWEQANYYDELPAGFPTGEQL